MVPVERFIKKYHDILPKVKSARTLVQYIQAILKAPIPEDVWDCRDMAEALKSTYNKLVYAHDFRGPYPGVPEKYKEMKAIFRAKELEWVKKRIQEEFDIYNPKIQAKGLVPMLEDGSRVSAEINGETITGTLFFDRENASQTFMDIYLRTPEKQYTLIPSITLDTIENRHDGFVGCCLHAIVKHNIKAA